jgi:hypothetical protein
LLGVAPTLSEENQEYTGAAGDALNLRNEVPEAIGPWPLLRIKSRKS